ncbi:MAG: glycosyltransferase [Flavobacteriales bacterium]|nr:glycosyltransferase [Flavobacteriales bacterium]MCB9174818.1 glycosyltransferase [Flavobacteriales bacterium]
MNIVIIGPAHPYRGGIALFNERLALAFQEDNHTVKIITFKLQYPSILFPGKTQLSEDNAPKNLKITQQINSINPLNWLKIGTKIKNQQPDLVIFSYWMPFMAPCFGTIASKIKKNGKTNIIGLIHNIIPHEKRIGDNFLSSYFTKQVHGFIAMSDSVVKDLKIFTDKPITLTPHPLYDNFGDIRSKAEAKKLLGLAPEFNYLLFFGIIRKYKGLDILLNAFADERLSNKNLKLLIAGEFYEDNTEYFNIIKEKNLTDDVIISDAFIPNTAVANYFCAADMVVQPYKHATQSGVTQIAYHFNKPMLVTDVGGLKEIVPNNVVGYVTQANSKSVADAINDFYVNNKEQQFIEGVKTEKLKYHWQTMTTKILDLHQKL